MSNQKIIRINNQSITTFNKKQLSADNASVNASSKNQNTQSKIALSMKSPSRRNSPLKKTRWYAGFLYRGNTKNIQDTLELIARKVQEFDLSDLIPLIRIERKNQAKNKQEFYLFVAIESEIPGQLPKRFTENLQQLPCFNKPAVKGVNYFTYEQIKPMVGDAHKVNEYTNPIPFREKFEHKLYDPFNDFEDTKNESYLNHKLINLIDLLSAKGYGSWVTFQNICQSLEIGCPSQISRNLKLLGYLETSANGKKWSITPTALIALNNDPNNLEFYLCGQQNTQLRQELGSLAAIKSEGQLTSFSLPRWKITFQDNVSYQQVIDLTGIPIYKPGNIAQQIANCLPTLQEWQMTLPQIGGIVPSQYSWQKYDSEAQDFLNCILPEKTGFYKMRRDTGQSFPDRALFYEADTQTWRQADWYGLRFLALHHQSALQECRYSLAQQQLAVPYHQRWPQLYERALVLASGFLSQVLGDRQWLCYHNISPELAKSLCFKLSLTCQGI